MTLTSPRAAGSELEMGVLFDEQFDYLWNTLRRLGVRDADTEDLVHEVFLKIYQRRAQYDPGRPLRPWLFGFAHRVAADYRRLARNRFEVLVTPADAANAPAPEEGIEARERKALVYAALQSVELERRAVLVMHDLDGVTIPEIARTMEIPVNTAYSRLRLAREDLAAAARRMHKAEGAT
jgi:RNA polymerase sigma-70 factor (ECF subfamily)